MVVSIIFLSVVVSCVGKMVYDHQLYKDIKRIQEYGQEREEGFEEAISI